MWFAPLFHGMVSPDTSYKLKGFLEYATRWFGLLTRLDQNGRRKLMLLLPGSILCFAQQAHTFLHMFRAAYSNLTSQR